MTKAKSFQENIMDKIPTHNTWFWENKKPDVVNIGIPPEYILYGVSAYVWLQIDSTRTVSDIVEKIRNETITDNERNVSSALDVITHLARKKLIIFKNHDIK